MVVGSQSRRQDWAFLHKPVGPHSPVGPTPPFTVRSDKVAVWALSIRSARSAYLDIMLAAPRPQAVETAADVIDAKPDCCATLRESRLSRA